jgi:hypothetical protein
VSNQLFTQRKSTSITVATSTSKTETTSNDKIITTGWKKQRLVTEDDIQQLFLGQPFKCRNFNPCLFTCEKQMLFICCSQILLYYELPPYVLEEIVVRVCGKFQILQHIHVIALIINVYKSFRNIRLNRC